MATTTTIMNPKTVKTVQLTVFDLNKFESILLKKDVTLPDEPRSLEEAMALYANQADVLVKLIYAGMVEQALAAARGDMSGFKIVDENGDTTNEEYHGTFADENKTKLINAAVLNLAKMQGWNNEMSPEEKNAIKENVRKILRETPAILKSIQG